MVVFNMKLKKYYNYLGQNLSVKKKKCFLNLVMAHLRQISCTLKDTNLEDGI